MVDDWIPVHKTAALHFSVLHFVCTFSSITHTNLHSTSHQHWESIILYPDQHDLTPRSFSNGPGMFSGAQSNSPLTITNGWFAAVRHSNVALNERKHAHQFHTAANTILLWGDRGTFFIQGAILSGKSPAIVPVEFLERGIINLLHSGIN